MPDKPNAILLLLIGACLVVFRKRFADLMIRKQVEETATTKRIQYRRQLKEMKLEGILHKVLETAVIVFGTLLLLISVSEFLPQTNKFITCFIAYSMLSFFAGCVAAFVELI